MSLYAKDEAYLDNSATTRVCDKAVELMVDVMQNHYGNPSSLHSLGVDAEKIMDDAREKVAKSLHCKPSEIVFTSGGTETNNLAVIGAAKALLRRGNRIVTTAIEHSSVLNSMKELEKQGFEVIYLTPKEDGAISRDDLDAAVNADTILVSMMLVNNETGAIQPVSYARNAVKKAKSPAVIHCDAVQAYMKFPIRPDKLGVDLLSVSSHKIHGPKGAGALYVRSGARILPVLFGGGQENGLRSGTEPLPAIAGFGEAAKEAFENLAKTYETTTSIRDYIIDSLKDDSLIVFNPKTIAELSPLERRERFAPQIVNFSVKSIRSETMLHFLESKKVYVSSGSACSKGAKSHVLTSMGIPAEIIDSALRISLSRFSTLDDAKALIDGIKSGEDRLARRKDNA
jgi:cysteine desulfurase